MSAAAFEILRSHSLPMLLDREIEHGILPGEHGPGDRINEKELAALFALAGRLFAARATAEVIAQTRGYVEVMDRAIRARDYDVYALDNLALHELIVQRAGNPVLANQYLGLAKAAASLPGPQSCGARCGRRLERGAPGHGRGARGGRPRPRLCGEQPLAKAKLTLMANPSQTRQERMSAF